MLRSRVIPCLLVQNKGLVKTRKFADPKYVGDPINAVKIFNEKEVDELVVFDIEATAKGYEPNYSLIERLAAECRMPLCYGGGIRNSAQARRIVELGVEKIAISSAAIENPSLVADVSDSIGCQSIVVVVDVKHRALGGYTVFTNNGTKKQKVKFPQILKEFEKSGAGEIFVNSIDNDGVMKGYDWNLVKIVRETVDGPISVLGGAGSRADLFKLIADYKVIGAAAGSIFVFKGVYRAVLISYLSEEEKVAHREHYPI